MDIEELEDAVQEGLKQYGFQMLTTVLAEACRRRAEDEAGLKVAFPKVMDLWETRANELEEIE